MLAYMQDAAGKVQGAAQTQYDYAKDTASNLADKTQGHAQDAHGQAKVSSLIANTRVCSAFFCPASWISGSSVSVHRHGKERPEK